MAMKSFLPAGHGWTLRVMNPFYQNSST